MSIFRKLLKKFRKTEALKDHRYIEHYTKCDECDNLSECLREGNLIESTTILDTTRHFINGLGCSCKLLERD